MIFQQINDWLNGKPFAARSSRWRRVRDSHLLLFPTCAACGTKDHLAVHHIRPYHLFPELELDVNNLLTLCESPSHNCHFVFGHLLLWVAYNPFVVMDAASYLAKVQSRTIRTR